MSKKSTSPRKTEGIPKGGQATDTTSTSKKKTPADSINSLPSFHPSVDFRYEFTKAKSIRFEWQDVTFSNEYDKEDGKRSIPFILIQLPQGIELKVYGSHLSSEGDWETSHLVEKNRKVGLEFIRPAINTVPPNIDFLFRQIADDSGGYTFHPFGLLCKKNSDLDGSLLNGTLQKARRDTDWIEIYRYVAAIKSAPEAILTRPSMFNGLWRILIQAIRESERSKNRGHLKLNAFLSIVKSFEDRSPTKLDKYTRALLSARSEHGRIPTVKEIKQALKETVKETVNDPSQVNKSLKKFGLQWIIAEKQRKAKSMT